MAEKERSQVIEQGDIFFFYRPKVGKKEVEGIEDAQRFYMVTSPEEGKQRLFVLGQKQLPEIVEGKSTSEERNWALNVLTTSNAEDIRQELLPVQYETETRGKRSVGPATPAGEGKYSIVKHDNHTELAYVLELPPVPGPTQSEFAIRKEASYIISVKNPDIQVPGFRAFDERKPEYSQRMKEKFGDRRWINVEDPGLLNYENTQVLLIGARKGDVEEELGIDLNEEKETANTAELFRELKIRKDQVPLKPLLEGEFPSGKEMQLSSVEKEVKQLSAKEAPGRKGGKAGGRVAAARAPSAAALSKILAGTDFPKGKDELLRIAEANAERLENAQGILQTMRELPEKKYNSMADVEKAFGKIR